MVFILVFSQFLNFGPNTTWNYPRADAAHDGCPQGKVRNLGGICEPDTIGHWKFGTSVSAGAGGSQGGPRCTIYEAVTNSVACVVLGLLNLVITFVIAIPLGIGKAILDLGAYWSINSATTTSSFVINGAAITLGIANMFFVLILLWMAIATIFDFEPYTAKSLLPKFIIMALLINFSVPIGGFFINFSNAVARTFYNRIGFATTTGGGNAVISIANGLAGIGGFQQLITQSPTKIPTGNKYVNTQCLITGTPAGDGYAEAIREQQNCYSAKILESQKSGFGFPAGVAALLWQIPMLLVLSFVFFAGGLLFIIRYFTLQIVLVFAPLAFFANILPSTQQYWKMWWDHLIKNALFAPVFLFMLYLVIESKVRLFSSTRSDAFDATGVSANMISIIILTVMSLIVAKMMGVHGANTVVGWGSKASGWGKKMALGAAAYALKRGAGGAAGGLLRTGLAQRMAANRFARPFLVPLEKGAQVSAQALEKRQKAAAVRRAGAAAATRTTDVNPILEGMRNDDERMRFMEEYRKQNRLAFERAVPNVDMPVLRAVYQEARRQHKDEFGEQLSTSIGDLATALEVLTGVNRGAVGFQPAVNAQIAAMKTEQLQRLVSANDIRAGGDMNEYLKNALHQSMDLDAFKALGNTPEKAMRLHEYFMENLGGNSRYADAKSRGRSDHDALMEAVNFGAGVIGKTNTELAERLAGSAAVQINIAYGRPLTRKASALPVAGIPPPAPATP